MIKISIPCQKPAFFLKLKDMAQTRTHGDYERGRQLYALLDIHDDLM